MKVWIVKVVRWITASAFLLAFAFMVALQWFGNWLDRNLPIPQEGYVLAIESGESLYHLTEELAQQGFLTYPKLVRLWAKYTDATLVQRGEYQLMPPMNLRSLLIKVNNGEVIQYRVTLLEGWRFSDFIQALQRSDHLLHLTTEMTEAEIVAKLNLPTSHPEGWFYPDTYHFSRGMSDLDILHRSHQKMVGELEAAWQARPKGLQSVLKTPYEALILASIVEKETSIAAERPEVAGVFIRRLEKGMRLQTDPTVIYGKEGDQANLTRADLSTLTPYNTYMIEGLPPTPIAMPSRASLDAVLNPALGETLFFVAKGDGSHHFSVTYAEHQKAVQTYQIERRVQDYRSTPETP